MFYNQTTDILGILTPIDDIDTKKVSRKYYSLEKLDVPNESQDELHVQNNTLKCIVLGN